MYTIMYEFDIKWIKKCTVASSNKEHQKPREFILLENQKLVKMYMNRVTRHAHKAMRQKAV
jgi:hypothetical protein